MISQLYLIFCYLLSRHGLLGKITGAFGWAKNNPGKAAAGAAATVAVGQ